MDGFQPDQRLLKWSCDMCSYGIVIAGERDKSHGHGFEQKLDRVMHDNISCKLTGRGVVIPGKCGQMRQHMVRVSIYLCYVMVQVMTDLSVLGRCFMPHIILEYFAHPVEVFDGRHTKVMIYQSIDTAIASCKRIDQC